VVGDAKDGGRLGRKSKTLTDVFLSLEDHGRGDVR